jgi:hypothetical protein
MAEDSITVKVLARAERSGRVVAWWLTIPGHLSQEVTAQQLEGGPVTCRLGTVVVVVTGGSNGINIRRTA